MFTSRLSFGVSVLLHLLGLAAVLLLFPPSTLTPPPAIELQLVAPVPELAAEAKPSPADAPILNDAANRASPKPMPVPDLPQVLQTRREQAEASLPHVERRPNKRPAPKAQIVPAEARPAERQSELSQETALPQSSTKDDRLTLESDRPAAAHASPPPTYIGLIRAKLEKEKRYPAAARSSGQEGAAELRFSIDRTGALQDWSVTKTSGSDVLDDEVGRMVRRAAPFPPLPDEMGKDRLTLAIPIEFSLTKDKKTAEE